MTEVPENTFTKDDLAKWYEMNDNLKALRGSEMVLRKKIFGAAFPDPKEGTNSYAMEDGYVLKGKHSLTREIDPGAFGAIKDMMREAGVNPDELVQYKPSLVLKKYRELGEDNKHLFEQCLIIKPGSPSLEIVLPAKNRKA